jgi:hypothetical protein
MARSRPATIADGLSSGRTSTKSLATMPTSQASAGAICGLCLVESHALNGRSALGRQRGDLLATLTGREGASGPLRHSVSMSRTISVPLRWYKYAVSATLNPFIWDRPLDDPSKIVGMEAFANRIALTLKGQTNVALFGPPDSGKTTFTNRLALELEKDHGEGAPTFDVVKVNLERVVSIPGLIGCVHDAMVGHPAKGLRRAAQRQISALEQEIGFDIRVVKGSVKSAATGPAQDAETLRAQLLALRSVSSHLVVVFDEFQRLRHCPGDPLAIIRSALMSCGSNHVSLLFIGSIRNALQTMLEDSREPILGEAVQMQLPAVSHLDSLEYTRLPAVSHLDSLEYTRLPAVSHLDSLEYTRLPVISHLDFLEYLDFQFGATGRPADEGALSYLLSATRAHPRSTQQLAWECWADTPAGERVTLATVIDAYDRLVQTIERSWFASVLNVLIGGDEAEANEVRALQLLADRGGERITSRPVAARYGFSSHSRVRPALVRLQRRGLVDQRDGRWYVVDPLFGEWLRRASPLADRPATAVPDA